MILSENFNETFCELSKFLQFVSIVRNFNCVSIKLAQFFKDCQICGHVTPYFRGIGAVVTALACFIASIHRPYIYMQNIGSHRMIGTISILLLDHRPLLDGQSVFTSFYNLIEHQQHIEHQMITSNLHSLNEHP